MTRISKQFRRLIERAPADVPVVFDIGGTQPAGVRTVGSCPSAFVIPVNLLDDGKEGLKLDAVTLPELPAACCDGIFSSHLIEHVPYDEPHLMFKRWHEVLKPGGWLETRCPDAEWLAQQCFVEHKITPVMYTELLLGKRIAGAPFFQWCHQNVWWFEKLQRALGDAGFRDVSHLEGDTKWLDWWPYDLSEVQYIGYRIKDLHVKANRSSGQNA